MSLDLNILNNFFSQSDIDKITNSGLDLNSFIKNFKSVESLGITNSDKFLGDLDKLKNLGLSINSVSDLENIKNLDPNKLLSNSIDIKSLKDNLSIFDKSGINLQSFSDQFSKIKTSGLDINKMFNFSQSFDLNSITGKLTSNLGNIAGSLTNQANGLLGNLTNQANGLVGGLNINNLTNQANGLVGGLNINNLTGQANGLLGNLTGQANGLLGNLTNQAGNLKNNLGNISGNIGSNLSNLTGNISGNIKTSIDKVSNLGGAIPSLIKSNGTSVNNPDGIKNSINNFLKGNTEDNEKKSIETAIDIRKRGIPILVPSQYIDVYVLSKWRGESALVTTKESKQTVWYDKDFDRPDFVPSNLTTPEKTNYDNTSDFGINIHLGYPGGKKVGNWSDDGSQCFSNEEDLKDFFSLCQKHIELYGNKFSYTVSTKTDWEQSVKNVEANKLIPPAATQSTVNLSSTAAQNNNNQVTNSNLEAGGATPTKKDTKVVDSNPDTSVAVPKRPSFFKNSTDVLAFQIWVNKNGISTEADGNWSTLTNNAWLSKSSTYKSSLQGTYTTSQIDSDIRLVHSRLQPYGEVTINGDGVNPVYVACFSKNSMSVKIDYSQPYSIFLDKDSKFIVYDNINRIIISKGVYSNGGRTIIVKEGKNSKNTFTEKNAWTAIKKIIN